MNALGIIFSELHNKNIPEMTATRTLASVPFGGRYRFIDFMLSSFVNSGVNKIGIITKSNYRSLMDHVGSGKSWDLSRKYGGIVMLPPHGESNEGLFRTQVEAIKSITKFIVDSKEEYVILTDCDNVCNIKFDELLQQHMEKLADITLVYREKYLKDSAKLVFSFGEDERLKTAHFSSKEGKCLAWTNIVVMKKSLLLDIIESSAMNKYHSLADIILANIARLRIFGYKFSGFYASVDSLKNYYKHSLELLDKQKRDSLFNKNRPIFTKVRDSAPARFTQNANVQNSIIADGCVIEGTVINSVLFRGVKVSKGARIENSILMQGTFIGENSSLNCVITDKSVVVKDRRNLSGHESLPYYIGKNIIL